MNEVKFTKGKHRMSMQVESVDDCQCPIRRRLAEAERLLRRYRTETPLGNQPHMIAHEADAFLGRAVNGSAVHGDGNG